MKFIVIIPARYESTRFPGKPLARILGEEMILRVCRQVELAGFPLAVATDHELIAECVTHAGFQAVITSSSHRSGTERVEEAYRILQSDADVVINVQGDEPFINPKQIIMLANIFKEIDETEIATLGRPFNSQAQFQELSNPNLVKLIISDQRQALYFSRSVIPYLRGADKKDWPRLFQYCSHIGIYAYKSNVLSEIVKLPPSPLEIAESLEQLRWLANGYKIYTDISDIETIGIDTPADLEEAERYLKTVNKTKNFL